MNNFYVQVAFWTFLAVILVLSFYLPWRYMKKKKQLDERVVYITHLSRSFGWIGSLGVIFVVWFLSLAVFQSLLAFWLISAIYVGHMLSYLFGSIYANQKH